MTKVFAVFLIVACFTGAKANAGTSQTAHDDSLTQSATRAANVAPLFLQNRSFSSALHIVNSLKVATSAKITLFDLKGSEAGVQTIQLDPDSEQVLKLSELLDQASSPIQIGSLRLEPATAFGVGVLAQLSITHYGTDETFLDEELSMPSSNPSRLLHAAADGDGGFMVTAVTNSSPSATQHVVVTGISAGSAPIHKSITLLPNQTRLIRPCVAGDSDANKQEFGDGFDEAYVGDGPQPSCGISLESDGPPGMLTAYGIVYHRAEGENSGYFSSVNFLDPATLRSPGLVFPGVPVGQTTLLTSGRFVPHLIVANFGLNPAHVTVELATTSGDTTRSLKIADVLVSGYATKALDLPGLAGDDHLQNSFIVRSDAAPGIVLTNLVSHSDGRLRELQLIGKDENQWENSGDHPWSVADNARPVLVLFNHASTTIDFNVKIGESQVF